ncbi:MAG: hypothetical protein ACREPI_09015 [Candidatus Dormibacterales bacterium]
MSLTLPFAASKLAVGVGAGITLAGLGTAAALAGGPPGAPSSSPVVKTCKASWNPGQHGIGACVSSAVSASPSASPTPTAGQTPTPSPSATPFGQLVKARVSTCKKAAAAAGAHGIGACVSVFATSHGANTTIPPFAKHGASTHDSGTAGSD